MDLHDRLEKAWADEGRFRDTHRTLTFTKRGLEIGNGTVVVKYSRDDWNRRILWIDGQEERILALLSVAWDQPMPDGIIEHFHNASRAFSKGELSLAHIHLAYTGLQPLEADEENLRLLFMAEGFLRAGVPGNEIRKAWGLGWSAYRKFNPNHYPAGDSRGGQFAPKDGGDGASSSRSRNNIQNVGYKIESPMPPPAPETARKQVVQAAEKQEGSKDWDINAKRSPYPAGANKCNLFVAEMLAEAGIPVPNESGSIFGIPRYPPLAAQWADPSVEIPGWIVLPPGTQPQPGDVVAEKINYSDASGHVGIVVEKEDGSGVETMSVDSHSRPERVKRTSFGFRSTEHPVFRRYVGPGASI